MMRTGLVFIAALGLIGGVAGARAGAQDRTPARAPSAITRDDLARAHVMLRAVYNDVQKHYYDADYHGVDLKARFRKYDAELDAAPTLGSSFRVIAAFLAGLKDTHTYFFPPPRSYDFFYGFRMAIVGDHCFITEVRPGTDAAAKVHPGDEIVRLNGYSVSRQDYHDLSYSLNLLEPQGGLRLELQDPLGAAREETVVTKFVQHAKIADLLNAVNNSQYQYDAEDQQYRQRSYERGGVFAWRLLTFEVNPAEVDSMCAKARHSKAIVMDLRGNGGGSVDTLKDLLGCFVKAKTRVGTVVGRKDKHDLFVSPQGTPFNGKLFVLVDSGSASASELFARTVQLQHLGTVIGDTSAGAVMESQVFPHQTGLDDGTEIGASGSGTMVVNSHPMGMGLITTYADAVAVDEMVMTDGKSLEHVGVVPDILAVPTAADLAAGRDTVMAKAFALAGVEADAVALKQAFPYPWPSYDREGQ